jgi:ferrous iron transport protein B
MKIPVVVALNMMDIAKQRKIHIEVEHLETHLRCPVIPMVANKKQGLDELKDTINIAAEKHDISQTQVLYDSVIEEAILRIVEKAIPFAEKSNVDSRWLTIKLLESDELAIQITNNELNDLVSMESAKIEKHVGDEIDIIVADGRYGFIHGLSRDVIHRHDKIRKTVSDNIDKVVLNRFLGIPIFFGVMYLMFMLTINVGAPFIDFFDIFMGTISILEDSGYMSRAAFVMDRSMRFIGLPGKAFIPMLVGFGCNVPAIMATRTLENNRDRILTILINPFMSCGARLPVYILFASVFFPKNGGLVVFTIYSIGIILAIISGLIFKKTILRGETSTFVMELPPYHIPTFNGIMLHTWQRLKTFLLRAGKVIIIVVIVLSFLNSIGTDGSFGNSENSILSSIGKSITPIFKPMGISSNNWPATVGLFTGIFAKEAVVGTLDALYSQLDETQEAEEEFDFWEGIVESFRAIPEGFKGFEETAADPMGLSVETSDQEIVEEELEVGSQTFSEMSSRFEGKNNAFAYLLFILIYVPCVAAIAVIYRETNLKWAIFSSLYLTFLAWLISTLFYQVSIFVVQPAISAMWIMIIVVIFTLFYTGMKIASKRITINA